MFICLLHWPLSTDYTIHCSFEPFRRTRSKRPFSGKDGPFLFTFSTRSSLLLSSFPFLHTLSQPGSLLLSHLEFRSPVLYFDLSVLGPVDYDTTNSKRPDVPCLWVKHHRVRFSVNKLLLTLLSTWDPSPSVVSESLSCSLSSSCPLGPWESEVGGGPTRSRPSSTCWDLSSLSHFEGRGIPDSGVTSGKSFRWVVRFDCTDFPPLVGVRR